MHALDQCEHDLLNQIVNLNWSDQDSADHEIDRMIMLACEQKAIDVDIFVAEILKQLDESRLSLKVRSGLAYAIRIALWQFGRMSTGNMQAAVDYVSDTSQPVQIRHELLITICYSAKNYSESEKLFAIKVLRKKIADVEGDFPTNVVERAKKELWRLENSYDV